MPIWKKIDGPRVSPTVQTVLQLAARHPSARRSVAEYGLVTFIAGNVEGLVSEMLKVTGRTPLSRGPLTQVSVLETRAFFTFWANHQLWRAKQDSDVRGSLIELLGVSASMEYYGHWPSSDEFNVVAGLFAQRANEYASLISTTEPSSILDATLDVFLEHLAASESGALPVQSSVRFLYVFDWSVGSELKLMICPLMKHMSRILGQLASETTDLRCLSKSEFDRRFKSACRKDETAEA
jgi:hypothetical protein